MCHPFRSLRLYDPHTVEVEQKAEPGLEVLKANLSNLPTSFLCRVRRSDDDSLTLLRQYASCPAL